MTECGAAAQNEFLFFLSLRRCYFICEEKYVSRKAPVQNTLNYDLDARRLAPQSQSMRLVLAVRLMELPLRSTTGLDVYLQYKHPTYVRRCEFDVKVVIGLRSSAVCAGTRPSNIDIGEDDLSPTSGQAGKHTLHSVSGISCIYFIHM